MVKDIQKDMKNEVIKIQDMRKKIETDYAEKKSELEQMQTHVQNKKDDMFETRQTLLVNLLRLLKKYLL